MTLDRSAVTAISPQLFDFLEAAGLCREPRGGSLFHYCGTAALKGILSTESIYGTNLEFFRDKSEFVHGRSIIERHLADFRSHFSIHAFHYVHDVVRSKLQQLGGYHIYVACFSEVGDDASQWASYGDGGHGFAIGFPWRLLSRNRTALVLGATYGDVAIDSASHRLFALATSRVERALQNRDASFLEDSVTSLVVSMILLAASSKQDCYRPEQEFRLMHLIDRDHPDLAQAISLRPSDEASIRRIRLALPTDNAAKLGISTIRNGPRVNESNLDDETRRLLRSPELQHVRVLDSSCEL